MTSLIEGTASIFVTSSIFIYALHYMQYMSIYTISITMPCTFPKPFNLKTIEVQPFIMLKMVKIFLFKGIICENLTL